MLAVGHLWSTAAVHLDSLAPGQWLVGSIMDMHCMSVAWSGEDAKHAMYLDMQTTAGLSAPGLQRRQVEWIRQRYGFQVQGLEMGNLVYVTIVHTDSHFFVALMHFGLEVLHVYGRSIAARKDGVKKVGRRVPKALDPVLTLWDQANRVFCPEHRVVAPKAIWEVDWPQVSACIQCSLLSGQG